MKRFLQRLRPYAASLTRATGLLVLLLALDARAGNYCNNPVPPCDPNDPASACYKPDDPPPKCEPKECDKCTKSPCYVGSGAYEWSEEDLVIRTTGFPISVQRLYRSTHAIDGESGYGWVSSLSTRLYYATYLKAAPSTYSKEANIRLPNGSLYRFVENANGTFTPPEGRFDTLVHNVDDTWDLWLQRSQSRLHFAANGNLLQYIDDYGNTQTWTYTSDRLSRVADTSGSGRYIDITYGADGRISDVTDLTGRNIHYAYNASGVLTSATNPAAQSTSYSYVNGKYVKLLSGITDHWGRNITTITYDAQDRVVTYSDKGETYTYTYAYNGNPLQTSKRDSSGNAWIYTFGAGGLVSGSSAPGGGGTSSDTYTSNGLVSVQTDAAGVKTSYTYNARGNPLTVIADYQGATAVEWRYVYDTNFPDRAVSYRPYTPGTNTIHPDWQGAEFEYYQAGSNAPGAMYKAYRLANDGVTKRLVFTFTYDTHGRLLTSTDALGNVTTTTYDSAGNVTTITEPSNNDAGTQPTSTLAHDSLGRVTSLTDGMGNVATRTYDVLDREVTITKPKPSPSSTLTFATTVHYDEYDSGTQLLFTRTVDPSGRTTKYGLDQWGQLVRNVDQAGNVLRYVHTGGLLTSMISPNNHVTTYGYDARRRRTTTTFPDGTSEVVTFNADNTIASIRDRMNQSISYTYDRHKRTITKSYPNGGLLTRNYTGHKLTSVTDTFSSPSETHTYTYDNWFRPVVETQASRGTLTRTYDDDDRVTSIAVTGGATATYGYYPDRSLRTITWSLVSGTFKYEYDLRKEVQSITFPNGQTRSYTYDDQSRITGVANVHPSTGTLASFDYGYDFDAFTGLATQHGLRTSVTTSFPAVGLSNALTKYGYDSRQQLIQATYPSGTPYSGLTQSWTYDALGNRLTATENGSTATYGYATIAGNSLFTDVLLSDGSNTYTHDVKGNPTARSGSRGNFTFSYDYENRLRSVNGDLTAGYLYDHIGRRSLKTVTGASSTYLYDGKRIIAEGGATPAQYLHGPGVDEMLAVYTGGQIYYYDVDGLGSVVGLNDASGTVQNSYAWDAWGVLRAQTAAVANSFGYTGREFAEAGRHYYRARYYEAAVGRFDSVDPLRWQDELQNLYRYVANRPTMLVDPSGEGYQPFPVFNCDPIPYLGTGYSPWSKDPVRVIPPNMPYLPTCPSQLPFEEIDFICTPDGWRKIRGPVVIAGGKIRGWDEPAPGPHSPGWIPPFPCPNKCPASAPPPAAPPAGPPGGPPSVPPMGPLM